MLYVSACTDPQHAARSNDPPPPDAPPPERPDDTDDDEQRTEKAVEKRPPLAESADRQLPPSPSLSSPEGFATQGRQEGGESQQAPSPQVYSFEWLRAREAAALAGEI